MTCEDSEMQATWMRPSAVRQAANPAIRSSVVPAAMLLLLLLLLVVARSTPVEPSAREGNTAEKGAKYPRHPSRSSHSGDDDAVVSGSVGD